MSTIYVGILIRYVWKSRLNATTNIINIFSLKMSDTERLREEYNQLVEGTVIYTLLYSIFGLNIYNKRNHILINISLYYKH